MASRELQLELIIDEDYLAEYLEDIKNSIIRESYLKLLPQKELDYPIDGRAD